MSSKTLSRFPSAAKRCIRRFATTPLRVVSEGLCLLLLIYSQSPLAAEDLEGKKLLRRVVVLDFVNQSRDENSAYLSVSIAEAFIGPLQRTGQFEMLNRDLARKAAVRLKLDAGNIVDEDQAIEIGKVAGAEVVVMGGFVVVGKKVRMQAKAVDVLAKRISVSQNQMSKLNSGIFEKIDKLAEGMSAKMAAALPPLGERTLVAQVKLEENIPEKQSEKKTEPGSTIARKEILPERLYGHYIYAAFFYPYFQPLYRSAGIISKEDKMPLDNFKGYGAKLGFSTDRFIVPRLYTGIEAALILAKGQSDVSLNSTTLKSGASLGQTQIDSLVFLGYEMISKKSFGFMPTIGTGGGYFNYKADGASLGSGFAAAAALGLIFRLNPGKILFRFGVQSFLYFIGGGQNVLQHRFEAGGGVAF